ncbi:MAG: hypothetical protein GY771_15815 [bacterium]|nr:hypothetical protein [bacterium]
MVRTITLTSLSLVFLPVALILILIGINAINAKKKRGIWVKLAVMVNSSLVLALGFLGCGSNANGGEGEEEMVMCYDMAMSDYTRIPDKFEDSEDWQNLENKLCNMENFIRTSSFDNNTADELYAEMKTSIENMQNGGLISGDDAEALMAYVGARHEYYCTNVGMVSCYDMPAIPPGKETTKKEIAETTATLRQLYEEGKVGDDAYNTALATLEEKLELYTDKEDNAVLRQLLLDLADGFSGEYYG